MEAKQNQGRWSSLEKMDIDNIYPERPETPHLPSGLQACEILRQSLAVEHSLVLYGGYRAPGSWAGQNEALIPGSGTKAGQWIPHSCLSPGPCHRA